MKKVLLQLDTDEHPSPFDAIVAHDAGVDVLLSHSGVKPESARALAQDAFFTRGPDDLKNDGRVGRRQERVRRRGDLRRGAEGVLRPLPRLRDDRLQRLQHDRGHDDRANRQGAQPRRRPRGRDRRGSRRAAVRDAAAGEGCEVTIATLPPDLFGDDRHLSPPARPRDSASSSGSTSASRATGPSSRGCSTERRSSCQPDPPAWRCCGRTSGPQHPTIELLADYNAAEPLGLEGTKATDDLAEYDGKLVLGALAIGGPKMKVHKTCVRRLFESNDQVLDTDAVYAIAKELV